VEAAAELEVQRAFRAKVASVETAVLARVADQALAERDCLEVVVGHRPVEAVAEQAATGRRQEARLELVEPAETVTRGSHGDKKLACHFLDRMAHGLCTASLAAHRRWIGPLHRGLPGIELRW